MIQSEKYRNISLKFVFKKPTRISELWKLAGILQIPFATYGIEDEVVAT